MRRVRGVRGAVRTAALSIALCCAGGAAARAVPIIADARFETIVAEAKAAMLADPPSAITKADAARAYADGIGDPARRALMHATAAWLAGEAYTRMGEYARATPLIERAVRESRRIAPGGRLEADARLSRGSIRAAEGEVAGAMADFHAAHDLFRTLGDPRSRARAFAQIANLYYDANDWANALKYFGQALEVFREDPGLAVSIRNGRGVTLMEMKRLDEASAEFEKALRIARGMNSPLLTATVLNNAARVMLKRGDLRAADRAIAESMALTRARGAGSIRTRQEALAAQAALQRRDLARAVRLTEQVFAGKNLETTTLADREAHRTAYETYRLTGREDLALAHLTAWKRLDDEATDLARSNGAALMAARFDFANQELRIANLKADDLQKSIGFERARVRTQRFVLIGGIAVALIVVAMLAFGLVTIRRSRDKVRAANTDLAATNDALGKALAAKTEFLATTSHEIRTPLNGILGMTQVMLADRRLEPATRDRVGLLHSAGVTMRALVDDILDVAKMETGNLTIETIAFDLRQAMTDATRMWEAQAAAKGLRFSVALDDAPGAIMGDPGRIRQIVFNLLSNAVKFTATGDIGVAVSQAGDRVRIVVTDTGIGIAPAHHEAIFESFRQADSGTTRQFGGTGLGLSICRSLSRAMGGEVTVASSEGAGATFTVDLPHQPATLAAVAPLDGRGGTLIVDRNPITRAMFKALLEGPGGPISAAATPDEAVVEAARTPPARILLDDATLGAGADPLGDIARLRDASGMATIALLCTATDAETHLAFRRAGVDLILIRPIAKDALVAALFVASSADTGVLPLVTQAA